MGAPVMHQRRERKTPFGDGTIVTSRCGRLRTLADGMNLTDDPKAVTCSFCKRRMLGDERRARLKAGGAE